MHTPVCPCRNTSTHSHGWATAAIVHHQTKPFLDNAPNRSELWLTDYHKQFYRYNSKRTHHDQVNKQTEQQVSGDHRIRITVNCGEEQEHNNSTFNGDQNPNYNQDIVSGASVTIVEVDDCQQLNDHTNTPNIIRNSLHVTPTSYISDTVKQYNEKPIDVPKDFERKAYEFQRNELSPFVRNLQPNSQVIVLLFCFVSLISKSLILQILCIVFFSVNERNSRRHPENPLKLRKKVQAKLWATVALKMYED